VPAYRRVGLRSRATGVARLENLTKGESRKKELRRVISKGKLPAKESFQTCNAGRAGAQPYRTTRACTPMRLILHVKERIAWLSRKLILIVYVRNPQAAKEGCCSFGFPGTVHQSL